MSKSGLLSLFFVWFLLSPPASSKVGWSSMVGLIGLEPMTPALSRRCSNQLSYRPIGVGGGMGIRTPDIQLAKLALYQLSYTPFSGQLSLS